MEAARQACRPKHQVLVRKCYPKFTKNNVEVKANSSELSYLLYYASTRRSKLQKVGDFLDKRTTADVWKVRTGNVHVTLQILKALIEKCPRDLPLYAPAVLRSLRTILKSNHVAMVEGSVPTFEALCAHQDPASLAADQDYIRQYEEIVQLYADFASKDTLKVGKTPVTWPVAIRFRKSGLHALKAVAASESFASETGRQLAVIIPVVLLNIDAETGDYLRRLESRETEKDEHEKAEQLRRRQSISTVRTDDEDADPIAASGTTEEADKIAEEEAGMIALEALRHIFLGVNHGQLRLATSAVLKFIGSHLKSQDHLRKNGIANWATTLLSMICSWAPVQDRYAILVCTVEALVRSPILEDDLERQLVLATVINHLLSSTINFIGLSVNDVLIGLISHTLLLLQLGGPGTSVMPHHQQKTSVMEKDPSPKASGNVGDLVMEVVKEPSQLRLQLLNTVKQCMASLAVHVYYTDHISEMVSAILTRLKPLGIAGASTIADAIEDPSVAVKSIADSLKERSPHVDRFFSFETARLTALETVKNIIETANARRPDGSSASVPRASVSVRAWEGTQWLLRDPSGQVRKSYVDALVTWLTLEKKKEDLKFVDDYRKKEKENDKGVLARRAVSNASQREKSPRREKNTFLALLHLAVYENALQFADSEPDLLLLQLLLTTLVNKLGVNAIRTGLPMILRLQEDISTIENPGAKVRVGSLVHGYLWAISIAMDFETSTVGRIIHSEISRRNEKGLWLKSIRVPPMPVDRIETPHAEPVKLPADLVQTEALKPFDNRDALVDKIADSYADSLRSPPSSPPASPGRPRSSSGAGRSMSIAMAVPATLAPPLMLPYKVKEDLLADWSREACLATNTKDPSSASMTGSRTAKSNYLGVNIPNGNLESATNSPVPSPRRTHSRPPSMAYGLVGRVASPHRHHSPSRTPDNNSSARSTVRVDDLKRLLSGSAPRTSRSMRAPSLRNHTSSVDSSASESMISVHSLSDTSFVTTDHSAAQQPANQSPSTPAATTASRPTSTAGAPASPPSPTNAHTARARAYSRDAVPPIPPIPDSLRDKSISPATDRSKTTPGPANGGIDVRKSRSVRTSAGKSVGKDRSASRGRGGANGYGNRSKKKPDFSGFLDSIDVDGDDDEGNVGRVPY
ncbi:hypothetical protein PMIN03_000111 [Paraphaeosphaeria minitans]